MVKVLRKYTDQERERYLEEYQNSDLTAGQYAREKGIPPSTFNGWLSKETDIRFGEIQMQTEENSRNAIIKPNKVFLTNTIRIELKQGYNKDFLRNVVEVLIADD